MTKEGLKATPFYSGNVGDVTPAFNPQATLAAEPNWRLAALQEHGRHEFARLRRLRPAQALA
jgi:hypothetical protein